MNSLFFLLIEEYFYKMVNLFWANLLIKIIYLRDNCMFIIVYYFNIIKRKKDKIIVKKIKIQIREIFTKRLKIV